MNHALKEVTEGAARLDKLQVGRSFARAAPGYDAVAHLQREVGDALLDGLPELSGPPSSLLDVGAGTGYCTRKFAARFQGASVTALDLAEGMLHRCRADGPNANRGLSYICGDAENLPLRTGSMDLIVSNLALQWCVSLAECLQECRRVLRPGGLLAFSSFGPGTLGELREAWRQADAHHHVLDFVGPRETAAALAVAGFREVGLKSRTVVLDYASVEALMRELKGLGASNRSSGRPRHLMGKGTMAAMIEAYAARGVDGRIPASFEIIHAYARRV